MIEQDTIRLLRECDAGIKVGMTSIDDAAKYANDARIKRLLDESREKHTKLDTKTQELLDKYQDDGKEPSPMARGMSWLKTNAMLTFDDSNRNIAHLMTDGCNMGIESLSMYLNQYKAADEDSKAIAKEIIQAEEDLAIKMREFL